MIINKSSKSQANVRKAIIRLTQTTDLVEAHQLRSMLVSTSVGTPEQLRHIRCLVDLLSSEDAGVRWHAADILLDINARRNLPHVLGLLNDGDSAVRASLCSRIAEKAAFVAAVDPLCDTMLHDPDSNVRFWAAFALGAIGSRRATRALKQAVSDTAVNYEGVPVSQAAAHSLSAIT